MELKKFNTDGLFNHYKNQIYKMLGLFEKKDVNAYKHAIRIHSEMEQLPQQFNKLYSDHRFNIVISKLDVIIEELIFMDGDHQFVANHVFESMNLLDNIKEGLR